MSTDDRTTRRLRRLLDRTSDQAPSPAREAGGDHSGDEDAPTPVPEERKARIEALRRQIQKITGRARRRKSSAGPLTTAPPEQPAPAWDDPPVVLPGKEVELPQGRFWLREKRYAPDDLQGTAPMSGGLALTSEMASLMALDEGLADFRIRDAVFLDIETTGLSMGTGTVAFLIGLGWYEEDSFVVHQHFVNRLENESAALQAMLERLGPARPLVTYNGKTFDVPVLRSRLALSRLDARIDAGGHLDLLHVTRRLYKRRIGDCSLDSVERSILGFHREGDIPGELIPEIFVEYLRTGRADQMSDVFHHNLLDVASMAALAGCMAHLASTSPSCIPPGDLDDLVSMAQVRLRHGDQDHAEHLLRHASGSGCSEHRIESRMHLALMARRRGDHQLVRQLLEQVLDDDPDHSSAHLMLAKVLEHKLRLPGEALAHARLTEEAEGFEASAHRVARLERKIARIEEQERAPE